MPERDKNDGLDHEEFGHWSEGAEQIPGGKVEEEHGVQGKTDRDIIDDGNVQVTITYTVHRKNNGINVNVYKTVQFLKSKKKMSKENLLMDNSIVHNV